MNSHAHPVAMSVAEGLYGRIHPAIRARMNSRLRNDAQAAVFHLIEQPIEVVCCAGPLPVRATCSIAL